MGRRHHLLLSVPAGCSCANRRTGRCQEPGHRHPACCHPVDCRRWSHIKRNRNTYVQNSLDEDGGSGSECFQVKVLRAA